MIYYWLLVRIVPRRLGKRLNTYQPNGTTDFFGVPVPEALVDYAVQVRSETWNSPRAAEQAVDLMEPDELAQWFRDNMPPLENSDIKLLTDEYFDSTSPNGLPPWRKDRSGVSFPVQFRHMDDWQDQQTINSGEYQVQYCLEFSAILHAVAVEFADASNPLTVEQIP